MSGLDELDQQCAVDPAQRVGLWTAVVGAGVFVALAVWLVPWDPIPGGDVPVPRATDVFNRADIERAEDFARWARTWSYLSLALSLAVAGWFGFTARGRRLVERLPGPWWLQVPLVVLALTAIGRLISLPCAVALQQLRRDEGLSQQAWVAWGSDLVKGELLTAVVTSFALLVLMACARRWQRMWPAIVGGLLAGLVVLGSFVYPVAVEPIFNDFESLPEGPLRSDIFALAETEGVELDDVLVADASRRTTTLNAYVSGLGGTRRVVVYDNLVDGEEQDVVLSVIAHELAHAKNQDVVIGTILGAAGALAAVGLLGWTLGLLSRRGVPGVGDARVVPLLLALFVIAGLVTAPIQSGVSRQLERRADVDALVATNDRGAFVRLQRRLALRSLSDPTPPALTQWWFGTHPTSLERIGLARSLDGG